MNSYYLCSLQKSISKSFFAGYTGSKNSVWNRLKFQFVELDFPKLIFQKSSWDQQGVSLIQLLQYVLENKFIYGQLSNLYLWTKAKTTWNNFWRPKKKNRGKVNGDSLIRQPKMSLFYWIIFCSSMTTVFDLISEVSFW